ncbi:MAG: class I SAM-dependent methyltransferase [Candidatus Aminicenantes bacterium]|nr:class I SAM-dependent methyltransferase [Candidatus Aminicenantes bacterium]
MKHINLNRPPVHQNYYDNLASLVAQSAKDIFREFDRIKPKPRIIDIGCGRGEIMKSLAENGFRAIGVDLRIECASISKEFGKVIVADLMTLDSIFPENSFDLAICSHVLEHIENSKQAVEIIKKISAKWLMIIVPNLTRLPNFFLRRPRYINEGHLHGWDSHHLKTLLELNCHLKIVRWVQDGIYLTPLHQGIWIHSKILDFIEYKFLPLLAPQMANSLIAVCEKHKKSLHGPK